jgi:hypothetical protein
MEQPPEDQVMSRDTDAFVDPCPPVALPPDTVFPVRVDVPIRGLLLRDADDLKDLNRALNDIRRIPQHDKTVPERDPIEAEAVATYFWLSNRIQAGEFAAYPGQYVAGAEKRVVGIDPDCEEAVKKGLEANPTLSVEQIIVVHVPDPNTVGPLIC